MVFIITDSTACLDPEFATRYHIPVIPQIINFNERFYYEGLQMDFDTFMRRLKASTELPKTAAPPPELFVEEFKRLVPTGEPILCIHPSAEVSGTIRSATVAAQEFPGANIHIIDTRVDLPPSAAWLKLPRAWLKMGNRSRKSWNGWTI